MDQPLVFSHGGTQPKPPSELRSPVLRAHGHAVAQRSVGRIYEAWPELLERYGERGRSLTAEDNHWHLNFLDAAVALQEPARFERYADWLLAFLGPRGLGPQHVAGVFGFLAEGLADVAVAPEQETHRQALVDLLKQTGARILPAAAP